MSNNFTADKHSDPFIFALALRTPETDTETAPVDLSKLPAYVAPAVAARLGVPAPGHTTETPEPTDYSDGYGHDYAPGE